VYDGFPVDITHDIIQDRSGRLWFAFRRQGLCCYDGGRVRVLGLADGLPGTSITCMEEDGSGGLWLGTAGDGLLRFDGEAFHQLTTADGLIGDRVSALALDGAGTLWVGFWSPEIPAVRGVMGLRGGRLDTLAFADGLAGARVSDILCDRQGRVWLATVPVPGCTESGGLTLVEGGEPRPFTGADGLGAGPCVRCLAEDADGCLWLSTPDGVLRLRHESSRHFTVADGLPGNEIISAMADSQGRVWFGTRGLGLSCWDGRRFVNYGLEHGLANLQVTTLCEDAEGGIWLGTFSGISRFDGAHVASFTTDDGLPSNIVMTVVEDGQGQLWAAGGRGVRVRCDGSWHEVEALAGQGVWRAHRARDGSVLMAGYSGNAWRCTGAGVEDLTRQVGMRSILQCVCDDGAGGLWFGSEDYGACHITPSGVRYVTPDDGLPSQDVRCILDDGDGVLIGTRAGLCRCDASGVQPVTFGQPCLSGVVTTLLRDRCGRLWVATYEGVVCIDGGETVIYGSGQLPHHRVLAMLEDRHGVIWIGTYGGGVARFDGHIFQTLCRRDGLAHDAIQDLCEDKGGDMWIATEGGLTRYRRSDAPPHVRLTRVLADQQHEDPDEVVMAETQKLVTFEFAAGSFTTRPEAMAFLCRLQGVDDDWVVTRERSQTYRELAVGEYTFEVIAVDRDFNRSVPARCRLIVEADARLQAFSEALSESAASEFVGRSQCLREVERQIEKVAGTGVTVLVLGETGTGKGLAARAVHRLSGRAHRPFIQVNCGSLPESLVESELYGHEKGAFTGAAARKLGKVEVAQGGTLFLDEIGDMPLDAQVKLLRLLEEGTFERVGGTHTLSADVRIVAATNRDLKQMAQDGTFRGDLFFRLQVFPVELPSLRERSDDIPLLGVYFMQRMAAHLHKDVRGFSTEAFDLLRAHPWPGNVRELEHAVQRAVIVCENEQITPLDLALEAPGHMQPTKPTGTTEPERPDPQEYERQYLRDALERSGGVIKGRRGAAALVGMAPSTLHYRLRKLGLRP